MYYHHVQQIMFENYVLGQKRVILAHLVVIIACMCLLMILLVHTNMKSPNIRMIHHFRWSIYEFVFVIPATMLLPPWEMLRCLLASHVRPSSSDCPTWGHARKSMYTYILYVLFVVHTHIIYIYIYICIYIYIDIISAYIYIYIFIYTHTCTLCVYLHVYTVYIYTCKYILIALAERILLVYWLQHPAFWMG